MADTQNATFAQAYSQNIMQLAQQKYSKLINTVYIKPNVRGKNVFPRSNWPMVNGDQGIS